ncbi:MAG: hypothetical protein OEY11_09410 [Gammaproteobacteria bacterium]|nr:hypothetical protein [Gammaproteobacteria bacterium]
MSPVLISPNKLAGKATQGLIFVILLPVFWAAYEYFSLSQYIPLEIMYPQYLVYAVAVVLSGFFSGMIYRKILAYQVKKMDLVVFSVNLAVDNSYHYLRAPGNMLTSDFFKYFFIYLMKTFPQEKYRRILEDYFLRLEIRRSDDVVKVLGRFTLFEGGIKDGDICQIIGKSKNNI